mgnify:CR=1 FL=1
MDAIYQKVFIYLVIVISAIIHEYAHGLVAYEEGDPTAKDAGRLTLNPLVHLDIVGTIIVPLFSLFSAGAFIGWAKPVPYNPLRLKGKNSEMKVAFAGPAANLMIALFMILGFAGLRALSLTANLPVSFANFIASIAYVNIGLALFNLIPVPPFDGSKIFMKIFPKAAKWVNSLGFMGIIVGLFIGITVMPYLADVVFYLMTGFGRVFM